MTDAAPPQPRRLLPELALVGATVAYGATFVVVQDAVEDATPFGFLAMRFVVGAVALAPFAWRRGWRRAGQAQQSGAAFVRAAAVLGLVGFAAYAFQTVGLQHTTSSNSAFITGLFVVVVPLIETVVTRRRPPVNVVVAVVGAVAGLLLLTGAEPTLGLGDGLTLVCAVLFGSWVYLAGGYAARFDPIALGAAHMVVYVVAAGVISIGTGLGDVTPGVVGAVLFTGLVASALAFTMQLWGQAHLDPAPAAAILLLEPVIAGFVGYAVGERLGVAGYLGAAVIFASIVVAESSAWRRRRPRRPTALDRPAHPAG